MKSNEVKCFCPQCVNLSVCTVKVHGILKEKEDENERLKSKLKECYLDQKSASGACIVLGLAIGVFLGYAWHYGATKNFLKTEHERIERSINEGVSELNYIKSSKAYKAVQKCSDEDWQAECISWEMKNAK